MSTGEVLNGPMSAGWPIIVVPLPSGYVFQFEISDTLAKEDIVYIKAFLDLSEPQLTGQVVRSEGGARMSVTPNHAAIPADEPRSDGEPASRRTSAPPSNGQAATAGRRSKATSPA